MGCVWILVKTPAVGISNDEDVPVGMVKISIGRIVLLTMEKQQAQMVVVNSAPVVMGHTAPDQSVGLMVPLVGNYGFKATFVIQSAGG